MVDPRLLRYTRGTRRFLSVTVGLGGVTACLVLAQAWLIATAISDVLVRHDGLTAVRTLVVLLAVVIVGRAAVAWLGELAANRASASAKSELRNALVEKIARLGPAGIDRERSSRLVVLATTGIDALDNYFARYVPQLFLAVIVPVAVIVVVSGADWISAVIIAVTVPLIPLFLSLVGRVHEGPDGATRRGSSTAWPATSSRWSPDFPTLKVFGRAKAQVDAVRAITDQYRRATMATLKVAFLSSLILELLATVSVALVAVAVGLRLLGGHLSLATALFVLILAPEAYLPLRLLGTNYHASAEGMQAIGDVVAVLEHRCRPRVPAATCPTRPPSPLRVEDLEVCYPGRMLPALSGATLEIEPGEIVAVAGPSGCGKSTLLSVLLGLAPPWTGSVRIGGVSLADLDPDAWRTQVAWVPQRTHLFARSIADNVRLGRPDATDEAVRTAISRRRSGRGGGPAPRRSRDRAGLRRVRPVGRRTPAGGSGPGLRARRAAPPARRADGQSRRPDRGGRARRHPAADGRAHRGHRGPPELPAGRGRPCRPTGAGRGGGITDVRART